ncbi:MAG: Hsp20/alpha crystallin family protein [Bradymonadales bacterium]|jgi:HSP20 family protein
MFTLWSDIDRAIFGYPFSNLLQNKYSAGSTERNACFVHNCRMNLSDKGEYFEFVAELPGLKEDDLELTVHADRLTLSAKRNVVNPEDATVLLSERRNYEVHRSVAFPVNVDTNKVEAKLKNGILRVTLQKSAENQPRKIAIT